MRKIKSSDDNELKIKTLENEILSLKNEIHRLSAFEYDFAIMQTYDKFKYKSFQELKAFLYLKQKYQNFVIHLPDLCR